MSSREHLEHQLSLFIFYMVDIFCLVFDLSEIHATLGINDHKSTQMFDHSKEQENVYLIINVVLFIYPHLSKLKYVKFTDNIFTL